MMLTLENSFSLSFIFTNFRWFYCFNWLGVLICCLLPQYSPEPRSLGFLLYCLKSCSSLCNPMECSLTGSSVHRISQARRWVHCHFLLQGIFPTHASCIAGKFFTIEPPGKPWSFCYCFLNFNVSKWWCILDLSVNMIFLKYNIHNSCSRIYDNPLLSDFNVVYKDQLIDIPYTSSY